MFPVVLLISMWRWPQLWFDLCLQSIALEWNGQKNKDTVPAITVLWCCRSIQWSW